MIVTVTLNPSLDKTLRVERLRRGELNRVEVERLDWGGKGFNVSRALLALGVPSIAIGVMAGGVGRALADGLAGLGLELDLIWVSGETRSNITLHETGDDVYTKINEPGPTLRAEDVDAIVDRVEQRARPGDIWVFSGSLPPGAPADLYARLIAVVQEAGARAVLDTSGPALAAGVAARPALVKPNLEEMASLTARPLSGLKDQVDALRELLGRGVGNVALTMGADGALIAAEGLVVRAFLPTPVRGSPIGAGDAFVAGWVHAWGNGWDLEERARWAVACGAAAAAHEGTGVGTREEVLALRDAVVLEPVA
ncbi:MAG: 1-phosphofructokinase [Anaerolineae bacterium]